MGTPKVGGNHWLNIAGTSYKIQGSLNNNLTVREANGRGSGDAVPYPIENGLEDGAYFGGDVISDDYALVSFDGTTVTGCGWNDGSTTVISAVTCYLRVRHSADISGLGAKFSVQCVPQAMPYQISHLSY